MTIKDKREYIKTAFRDYMNNKRRLEQLVIPGLGGVDYARPSVVSDKYSQGCERKKDRDCSSDARTLQDRGQKVWRKRKISIYNQ